MIPDNVDNYMSFNIMNRESSDIEPSSDGTINATSFSLHGSGSCLDTSGHMSPHSKTANVIRRDKPTPHEMTDIKWIQHEADTEQNACKDPGYDVTGDYKVARFLIACRGDREKALKRYKKSLEMRAKDEYYLERLRKEVAHMEYPEFNEWWSERCHPFMPIYPYCGQTNDGDVLVWIRVGMMDANRFTNQRPSGLGFSKTEERLILTLFEWLNIQIDKQTRIRSHFTYCIKLFDFKRPHDWCNIKPKPDFPLDRIRNPGFYNLFTNVSAKVDRLYPETDRTILITNPCGQFNMYWMLAKPFAKKSTLSKIRIVKDTKDPEEQDLLHSVVDRSLLPKPWGGEGVTNLLKEAYQMSHGERLIKLDEYIDTRTEKPLAILDKRVRRTSIQGVRGGRGSVHPNERARRTSIDPILAAASVKSFQTLGVPGTSSKKKKSMRISASEEPDAVVSWQAYADDDFLPSCTSDIRMDDIPMAPPLPPGPKRSKEGAPRGKRRGGQSRPARRSASRGPPVGDGGPTPAEDGQLERRKSRSRGPSRKKSTSNVNKSPDGVPSVI